MSASATNFGIYLSIGVLVLTIAVAPGTHRRRKAELLGLANTGTEFSAGYLIFVALLWPIWLIAMLTKK